MADHHEQSQHAPPAAHGATPAAGAAHETTGHAAAAAADGGAPSAHSASTSSPGSSWVYLFSQFTTEALLFEGLLISVLCAGYAAFWILRKRRLGVIDQAVPAGVVRTYLNALILDAESLRAQLFGLLASHGIQLQPGTGASALAAQFIAGPMTQTTMAHPASGAGLSDPELLKKFSELERKMVDQTKAMDSITGEKVRLEKELAEAKAKGGGGAGGAAGDTSDLNNKIKELEARLAEYSVIEDDLANLKRLQQENAKLKAALAGAGGAVAAGPATPAPSAPAPVPAAEAAPEPSPAAPPAPSEEAQAEPLLAAEAAPVVDATENTQFENLVDQVEQSLQDAPAAEAAPVEAAPAAPEPATPAAPEEDAAPMAAEAAPTPESDKSNDDLVAEFEKMLNS